MRVMNFSVLAASLIGGAVLLAGAQPASALTLAPGLAETGDTAAVHEARHDMRNRSGRVHGPRYRGPKNDPYDRYQRWGYRGSGPAIGLGLSVPGFSLGLGVPSHRYSYGYSRPYGYGPYGYRGYGY